MTDSEPALRLDPHSPAARRRSVALRAAPTRSKTRASNTIIDFLLREIAVGDLARGSRLPNERDLAEHFRVSQPTVREAVRALDAMGLVEVRHGSGAYVTADPRHLLSIALTVLLQLEQVDILDVLSIRALLGHHSARLAATAATPADIDLIDQLATGLEQGHLDDDPEVLGAQVIAFQDALSAASHNPLLHALETFLIALLVEFQLATDRRWLSNWKRNTLGYFARDRRAIVNALRSGDVALTVEALDRYLRNQHELFAGDKVLLAMQLSDILLRYGARR